MLERFQSETHKVPKSKMFSAVFVLGRTDNESHEPRLDSGSRMSVLTAGVVEDAEVSDKFILVSDQTGTGLMKQYLDDAFNVNDKTIILEARQKTDRNDADMIRRMMRKFAGSKRLGIITTVNPKTHKLFGDAGISLSQIPPEDILNNRIAASAANSPNTLKQVAIEIGQQFLKYKRLMTGGVGLYELGKAT